MQLTNKNCIARAEEATRGLIAGGANVRMDVIDEYRRGTRCSVFLGDECLLKKATPEWAAAWVEGFAAAWKRK